jgi:hypothetical protein
MTEPEEALRILARIMARASLTFNRGISREGHRIDLGTITGLANKAGAFLTHGDTKPWQGRQNAGEYLRQHPESAAQLEEEGAKTIPGISQRTYGGLLSRSLV